MIGPDTEFQGDISEPASGPRFAVEGGKPVAAKFWSQTDFWMGVVMGLYVPMNSYARNADCFSTLLRSADKFILFHRIFDHFPFTMGEKIRFGLNIVFFASMGIYAPISTCMDERDEAISDDWAATVYDMMRIDGNAAELFEQSPIKHQLRNKGRTDSGWFMIPDLLTLYAMWGSWGQTNKLVLQEQNQFYWYEKGLYPARFVGLLALLTFNVF